MGRISVVRRMIAVLAILAIFVGTQGFVISSHICNSCGTHEKTISFFGSKAGNNHDCQAEASESCCSATASSEEAPGSCCKTKPAVCETIESELCCEFDSERVTVETLTVQKTLNNEVQTQQVITESIIRIPDTGYRSPVTASLSHDKHGGGREITRLNCRLQI